jgi:hypothetical protein
MIKSTKLTLEEGLVSAKEKMYNHDEQTSLTTEDNRQEIKK